jgi:outer membrane lipoprotein-sorting protein
MKKKYIIFLLIGFGATGMDAQNTKQLLNTFTEKITGYKTIEMAFTLTFDNPIKGAANNYEGTLLCMGDKYRLLTDEWEVYCDGRSKWLCNKETNEVVIQYVSDDNEAADITDHPLRFLTSYAKEFSYKQKGESRTDNGTTLIDIVFLPKEKKAAYTSIQLTLEKDTALPHTIQYHANNGNYSIRITRITPDVAAFDGYFAFPKHRFPTIEIIDLR